MLESCREMVGQVGFDPTTVGMVQAATRRGIPWVRLSPSVRHVQLGHGYRQRRCANTMLSNELGLARYYANDKSVALSILSQIRLPVGRFAVVKDVADARKRAVEIGYPLVLKPVEGRKGNSVHADLRNDEELTAALAVARVHERQYLLQSYFHGDDHRLMVVDGKLVAAARKDTASVTGDGIHTIAELMERENRDPRRIAGVELRLMPLDEETDRILARQGCTRATIPEAGRVVRVKGTANFAKGGGIVDVLDVRPSRQCEVGHSRRRGYRVEGCRRGLHLSRHLEVLASSRRRHLRSEHHRGLALRIAAIPRSAMCGMCCFRACIRKATTAAYRPSW